MVILRATIGFPPNIGGPFCYIQQQGKAKIVQQMQALAESLGEEYLPCEALKTM